MSKPLAPTNPSEIARETLRRLAAERIPPTPDNYRALYHQISGTHKEDDEVWRRVIQDLIGALLQGEAEQAQIGQLADSALRAGNWKALGPLLKRATRPLQGSANWDDLLRSTLLQLSNAAGEASLLRRRDSLAQLLARATTQEALAEALTRQLAQWSQEDAAIPHSLEEAPDSLGGPAVPRSPPAAEVTDPSPSLVTALELAAFILESSCATVLALHPKLSDEALRLSGALRQTTGSDGLGELQGQIRKFAFQVENAAQDNAELHAGVVHLLQLVIDNISELVLDERWLNGQIKLLQDILSRPLDVRSIDAAERKLREIIFKQSQLKAGLADAQESLKSMLSDFVEQLASFETDTGAYSEKIDAYAQQISRAGNIVELQSVIEDVLRETRHIRQTALRTQTDLQAARRRVSQAELRVTELEEDLARTSKLVQQDQLTGTLNRRGLEEVLNKEVARAKRRKSPICLAVLDIDNFKQLNDHLGHQAGDEALVHLTGVIRSSLRPQDSLARLGGEEFVILLPDTPLPDARDTIVRVQRELTRRFFLHDNQKILITFSAGVTEIPAGQAKEAAIARADELMYQAKQAGKNKVISA